MQITLLLASKMRRLITVIVGLIAATNALQAATDQPVGHALEPWSPGMLDIHHISTGAGNACLLILPDGTSVLVDAGNLVQLPASVRRPDGSRGAGEWIARYAQQALRHDANPAIDVALITHLHGDHMGAITKDTPTGNNGYKLSGLSEVAEYLPIKGVFDRGWPDYRYPSALTGPGIEQYRLFLEWQRQHRGLQVERFVAGRNDQLRLLRNPAAFPDFEIRNIVVNGEIWTGAGMNTRQLFPPLQDLVVDDYPSENACSTAVRLSFGRFTYYAGGDLTGEPPPGGPAWNDVESALAPVVGPVDVAVLNHHGMDDATNEAFLRGLRPRVMVIPASNPQHPDIDTVRRIFSERIYAGPRDVFATGMLDSTRTVLFRYPKQFKSTQGHVVIRVRPGGETYQIFALDDSTESYAVTGVFGPYQSH